MNKKGFTLVELMVVIVIIGVLAAVAIPKMMAATNKAKAGEGPQILRSIANMEATYKAEADMFLVAPATKNDGKPKGKDEAVADAWLSLGFDIEPFSKYFVFEVPTATGESFSATATLYQSLGDAVKDNSIEIDERDVRTVNGKAPDSKDPLAKLLPNWK
jgi:prepilin-type N-terminal cleavage/methylation domain-containing protein